MKVKFRVWDKITRSYSGGCLWSLFPDGKVFYGNAEWPESVVELYTGERERDEQICGNGSEIYFGDIVRCFGGVFCQVFHEYDETIIVKTAYDIVLIREYENVQILGNIHETPQLIPIAKNVNLTEVTE